MGPWSHVLWMQQVSTKIEREKVRAPDIIRCNMQGLRNRDQSSTDRHAWASILESITSPWSTQISHIDSLVQDRRLHACWKWNSQFRIQHSLLICADGKGCGRDSMTGKFETKVRKSQPKPYESKRNRKKSQKIPDSNPAYQVYCEPGSMVKGIWGWGCRRAKHGNFRISEKMKKRV